LEQREIHVQIAQFLLSFHTRVICHTISARDNNLSQPTRHYFLHWLSQCYQKYKKHI
jgi:hypothetical protein